MRPLILVFSLMLNLFAASQQKTGYLLWYKGTILKPNVLLTAAGDTIIFSPSKGILKVSPGKKSNPALTTRVRNELRQTPRRIEATIKYVSTKVPKAALPLLASQIREGYESVRDQYEAAVSNELTLPDPDLPQPYKPSKGPAFLEEADIDLFKMLMDSVAMLQRYVDEHEDDVLDVPVPPRQDYTYCAPCQTETEAYYKNELERMTSQIAGSDYHFLQKVFSISRTAMLLLGDEQLKPVQDACERFKDFVLNRYNRKAELLWRKYGEDPYRIPAVLMFTFIVERYNQMLGCSKPLDMEGRLELVKYELVKFIHKVLDERDYSIALNLNFLLNFGRTCQLLLGSFETDVEVLERALKFNRFKMNIHISGKIGKDDGFQLAELKSDNWFMAIPDTSCRLKWILIEPLVNKMEAELVATDWRGKGVVITYTGPKKWISPVPKMRMDFCHPGTPLKDTIQIYQFDAEGFNEKWLFPRIGEMKVLAVNNAIMTTFLDIDKLKEQAEAIKKDPATMQKMQKEMMAKLQEMQKSNMMQSVKAGENIDVMSINNIAKMQDFGRQITEMIYSPAPNKYHFEPVMRNREKIIVNEKLDGKELFPNPATQYAWFFLRIEHDPNGPLGSIL